MVNGLTSNSRVVRPAGSNRRFASHRAESGRGHCRGSRFTSGGEEVEAVQNNRQLESNDLLYAVLAEFESQLNDLLAAASLDSIAIHLSSICDRRSLAFVHYETHNWSLFFLSRLGDTQF